MRFVAEPVTATATGDIDWPVLKAEILSKLDVAAEFTRLGVEFSKPGPNSKGIRECYAIGRKDDVPSAFVNVNTGVYHDSGGEGESVHLFDFALRHGQQFGRWVDVIKHYAERAGVAFHGVPAGKGGKIAEAVYLYRNPDGTVRYRVVRHRLPNGKKTFSQNPSDGKGGWRFGEGCMDGVEPIPYRLPELLNSDPENDPVWICEGEKDCDRLASLGFVSTTNHQGAQSTDLTWPKFVGHFRGRECYVIPDNDPGGRNHARKVAAYLKPVARRVRIVELPDVGLKGDVSDWLDQGHDVDELGGLAAAAADWEPGEAAPPEDLSRDATAADIRATLSGTNWVWPLWIPSGELTLLAAEGGTGKTRFCFDLARRIHHNLPWPDGTPMNLPRNSRTLWVAADNQWQEIATIPASFGIPDELILLNATAEDPFAGTSLETPDELEDLEARIRRVRPALVFIDTITNTGDFKSQDSSDAKRQYKPLQEIASKCQTAIVCVTHLNAGGKVLGRRAVEKVRVVIQMEYPDPEGQADRRKLVVTKSKAIRPPALGITMGEGGNEYDTTPPEAPGPARHNGAKNGPPPAKTAACMTWLAALLSQGAARVKDIRDAAETAGHAVGTLYEAKERLGVTEDQRGVRNHKFWTLGGNNENGHPVNGNGHAVDHGAAAF